jgi:hypothetical protein
MPSELDESKDAAAAESVYEAYSNLLLERTRDKSKFPLVFEELTNYGFRRNLWALKPIGIVIATASLVVQLVHLAWSLLRHQQIGPWDTSLLAMNLLLLTCWVLIVNPLWVKRSADAYADRLLAASEKLGYLMKIFNQH